MQSQQSILIQAPIETVWKALTDIDHWPKWQNAVSEASLAGALAPSSEFQWKSGGFKIKSTIREIKAPSSIRWTGRALGTKADNSWALESQGSATRVTTSESMTGWLVSLIGLFQNDFLSKSLKQALENLKMQSERNGAV